MCLPIINYKNDSITYCRHMLNDLISDYEYGSNLSSLSLQVTWSYSRVDIVLCARLCLSFGVLVRLFWSKVAPTGVRLSLVLRQYFLFCRWCVLSFRTMSEASWPVTVFADSVSTTSSFNPSRQYQSSYDPFSLCHQH